MRAISAEMQQHLNFGPLTGTVILWPAIWMWEGGKQVPEKETLLKVENLKMYFPAAKSVFGKTTSCVKAVDDVSFEVEKGKTW